VIRVSRTAAVAGAVVVQAVLVAVAVAPRLSARLTGDEYLVRVAPVDPIDPFRGAYVRLHYPDLVGQGAARRGDVYVRLLRDGRLWRTAGVQRTRPSSGPYLACRYDGTLRCGIESLFLPQADARALERELAAGDAVARIRVDGRGNAAVVGVEPE
jgi:uncharacterized membrane-anchored protein